MGHGSCGDANSLGSFGEQCEVCGCGIDPEGNERALAQLGAEEGGRVAAKPKGFFLSRTWATEASRPPLPGPT